MSDYSTNSLQLLRRDAIEKAEFALGATVDAAAPRVVIVSSTSGGTGSGMLMDVAYAARQILGELGLPDEDVQALLCHWTPRNQAAKDLARANSYACLSELQHFLRSDRQFPGDPAAGLKSGPEDSSVFKQVCVMHLGEELGPRELSSATRRAAAHLYFDTVTQCGLLSEAVRDANRSSEEKEPWDVRAKTVELFELGGTLEETIDEAAQHMCNRVILNWRGAPARDKRRNPNVQTVSAADPATETDGSSLHGEATRLAGEKVAALQLNYEELFALAGQALESTLGAKPQEILERIRDQVATSSSESPVLEIIEATDAVFGSLAPEMNQADELNVSIRQSVQKQLEEPARKLGEELSAWILGLLDCPSARLKGAEQAAEWLKTYLRDLQDKCTNAEQETLRDLTLLLSTSAAVDSKDRPKSRSRAQTAAANSKTNSDAAAQYIQLRWTRIATVQARQLTQSVLVHVGGAADLLRDLDREFRHLERIFGDSLTDSSVNPTRDSENELARACDAFGGELRKRLGSLVAELDNTFCNDHFASRGGIQCLVTGDTETRNSTPDALLEAARRIIKKAQQQIDISELLLPKDVDSEESASVLKQVLQNATPRLAQCGGRKHLAVVLPVQADQQRVANGLQEHCDQRASYVQDKGGDVLFLTSVDDVPLSRIAVKLIDGRSDYAEAASRLYSRCDVDWTPWDDVQQ